MQIYLERYNPLRGPFAWFVAASLVAHALALVLITQLAHEAVHNPSDSMIVRLLDAPSPKPAPVPAVPARRAAPAMPPHSRPMPRPAAPIPAIPLPSAPAPGGTLRRGAVAPAPAPMPFPPDALAPSRPEGAVRRGAARPKIDFSDIPQPSRGAAHEEARLVDPAVIDQYAERVERKVEDQKKIGITTDEFKYRDYMRRLKARIEGIWDYPREAAERGISGDLEIEFTINRDGTLGKVRLARTSGFPDLDEAALRAVRDAAPYWPMPADWEEKGIIIMGHFIYHGPSGKYIR